MQQALRFLRVDGPGSDLVFVRCFREAVHDSQLSDKPTGSLVRQIARPHCALLRCIAAGSLHGAVGASVAVLVDGWAFRLA